MLMPSIFRKGFIDDVFEDDFFGDNLKNKVLLEKLI